MAATDPKFKIRGLNSYPNPLGEVPPGSLALADNIVIDAPGEAQSRRGLDQLSYGFGSAGSRANKIFNYQNVLLVHYGTNKLAYDTGAAFTDYSGTYAPISSTTDPVRSSQANSNFYFTTDSGVKKLDVYNGTPVSAGGLRALDTKASTTGGSGFLSNNSVLSTTGDINNGSPSLTNLAATTGVTAGQYISGTGIPVGTTVVSIVGTTVTMSANATATTVGVAVQFYRGSAVAYRILWGFRDANNNLIYGTPSQREVLVNTTSGSRDVSHTITVPSGATTSYFFQIYRSPQTVSASIEPTDEMQLVYEANPSSGEISAKLITVTDNVPDSLKGVFLYTSSSQEGIGQANEPPPLSRDLALFSDSTFYVNLTRPHGLTITLLSVGGSSGIAAGDDVVINGITYRGDASIEDPTLNPPKFIVTTSGTPAQNIRDTATSLIRVINRASANTDIYAYYLSAYSELPGKIQLQRRSQGGSSFAVTASAHGSAWNPALPTAGTAVSSTAERLKNGIGISKTGQPEAVPLTNILYAGSAGVEIKRIVPLRDSLFIFKDDGIFRITGSTPSSFTVDAFDDTTKLLAPETAVSLNNTIYCLTNQGVASVSDTGVGIVSRPIEGDLLTLFGISLDNVKNLSWGVSYQSDRKYLLGVISNSGDTTATQIFVYNFLTDSWTRWPLTKRCGLINSSNDKLYLGDSASNKLNVERKMFDQTDYVDGTLSVTISASSGTTITLASTLGITVGDLLYQSSTVRSVITAINGAANQVTVQDTLTWSNGAATVYSAIECLVQFQPQTGGSPQSLKHFSELELFFRRARFNSATIAFTSDLSQSQDSLSIAGVNNGAWGLFPWGSVPWGGQLGAVPRRTYVPRNKQRCSQLSIKLTHRVGYGDFILEGFNLKYRTLSQRVSR